MGGKGDWPALCKLGGLNRHHGREAHQTASAGICHLCDAGQPGHDFHRFDFTSMLKARTSDLPWTRPSSLSRHIPQSPSKKEMFYKIDLFHVGHKGVMGDVCANAIATCHIEDVLHMCNLFCGIERGEKGDLFCFIICKMKSGNIEARFLCLT